jgi:hypothetical protein
LQKPATPDVASDDGQYAVLGNFLKRVAGSVLIVRRRRRSQVEQRAERDQVGLIFTINSSSACQ